MGKTQKQYYDEIYDEGKRSLDQVYSQKKKTDAQALTEINKGIDQATSAAVGQYEQRIAAAPKESRVQFDQNAVRDAVAKKQVQERLANMGVTDSGLNSSMQTALAIQKQRADNTVRADEAAKIQAYREAIDKIVADGEIQKGNHQATVKKDTAEWYAAALAELENNSQKSAAEAYGYDKSIENEEAARLWNAEQARLDREFTTSEREAAQEWSERQNDYARIAKEYQAIQERKNAIGKAKNTISSETYFNNNAYKNLDGSFEFEDEVFKDYKDYVIWKLQRQYNEGNLDEEALYELFHEYGIS